MTIDEQIVAYLTPRQKEQLAQELEINELLPKKRKADDDCWRDPLKIKKQAIENARYLELRAQEKHNEIALANTIRIKAHWDKDMTEKEKLQKALSKMIEQFIGEVNNQPMLSVNYKNVSSVNERRNQLTIMKQTMETIRGLKDLLASMEEDDQSKPVTLTADNVMLMDQAKQLLANRGIKSQM